MKKNTLVTFRYLFATSILIVILSYNVNAQLTTTRAGNYKSMTYLVNNVLLGSGIVATNIKYQGIDTSFGFFNGTKSNIGMDTGLIITNGTITLADGPNCKANDVSDGSCTTYAYSTTDGWPASATYQDTDLANLIGTTVSNTFSCAVLQFDFVATSDSIEFQYSFGSNEEPHYVGSKYLDDFGFFLSGPGIAGPFTHGAVNLALVPFTATAVYINSVNCSTNSAYYVCNWPSSPGCSTCPATVAATTVGYNGFTTVLTAAAHVQCGQKYHIKLGVADIGNGKFDSGVFLKGGSFKPATASMAVTTPAPICSGSSTAIVASNATSYTWSPAAGLSATTGATVTANPTVTTIYTVVGTMGGGCDDTAKVTVTVNPTPTVTVTPSSPSICAGSSTKLTAAGATTYTWSPATGLSATTGTSVNANPASTTTYTVTGKNASGCTSKDSVTVTVTPLPVVSVIITGISPSICGGDTMGMIASGATTYTWSPATGLNQTTGSHVIANPTSTTTYIVTGTTSGCSNTASITITVFPTPTVTVTPSAPAVCPGGSVTMTAGGASTYAWSPATGLNQTTGSAVISTPASTTTYTVVGTSAGGCKDTTKVTVTVSPGLTVTITPASPLLCNGDSVVLNANGAANYTWSPAANLSCTNCPSPIANPTSSVTYTVTGTSGSCSAKDSVTITISPKPVITVSATSSTVCTGSPTTLNAGGGSTYTWSPATGLSATTGSSVTANPTVTTTYIVTGTNASGCTNTASVTITVNPLPVVSATAGSPNICSGTNTTLTAIGASTYSWSPGTGLSATTGSPVTASPPGTQTYTVVGTSAAGCNDTTTVTINVTPTPTVTINPASPGICSGDTAVLTASGATTYSWSTGETTDTIVAHPATTTTYTVTGTNGGCTSKDSVKVSVGPLVVTVSASSSTICSGASSMLTAAGATTYTWKPGTGLSSTTGSPVTATPGSTQTYTVIGTSGSGCIDSAKITITVNPTPTLSVTSSAPLICFGDTGETVKATGAKTYNWSPSTGVTSPSDSVTTINPGSTTTYTVTGTSASGCPATATVTITVDKPVVTASSTLPTVCAGSSTTLDALGASTYAWSPGGSLSCTTCSGPNANPATTTTYTVVGTDASGCKDSANVTVTVNALPTISVVAGDSAICSGQLTSLTASGASSYTWTPASGLSCTTCANPNASPATTTTYTVVGTDAAGCSDSAKTTLTVNPTPSISISLSGNDTLCLGQSVTMTASGGVTYAWKPATALSCTACPNPIVTPATSPLTYTVVGSSGMCSDSAVQSIYLYPPLNVTMKNDTVCVGRQAQVSVTVAGGKSGYTYVWSSGLGSGPGPYNVTASSSSFYVCTVTDGCGTVIKDSEEVYSVPVPKAIFTAAPDTIMGGQYVTFSNLSTGATSYFWNFGDGGSSNAIDPYYQYNMAGNFIVYLVASNSWGCADTASDTIYVTEGIVVPNVFTPNGDGMNDVFHVRAGGLKTYEIEIFNRWGQKVFESDSPMIDWTGRSLSGVEESDGTYYWIIKATDYANKNYNLDGYLQLIR